MNTQILGLHHVTAMTSSAEKIYHFFTDILGLRLIKKTVNQDDIETYHLFFADILKHIIYFLLMMPALPEQI